MFLEEKARNLRQYLNLTLKPEAVMIGVSKDKLVVYIQDDLISAWDIKSIRKAINSWMSFEIDNPKVETRKVGKIILC